MPNLNMNGPFELNEEVLSLRVTIKSPGNFALGYTNDKKFVVRYIGRSDTDIRAALTQYIGQYTHFKYSYYAEAKAAFDKHCRNFHDFGGTERLENEGHPEPPTGSDLKCPFCDQLG